MHRISFSLLLVFIAIGMCGHAQKIPGSVTISVNAAEKGTTISPLLMGFNNVYCYEPDKYWQNGDGKIAAYIKNLNTGVMRYPGGTVVGRFDWEQPSGQGWTEPGEPGFKAAGNRGSSEFMDIDEYLTITKKLGTEPLVGINMSTGIRYNKIAGYPEKAKRLVKHCLDKGVKVKYYYLDNEPYIKDVNISYKFTATSYAEQFNLYAAAIKSVDPDVKLIANTHPSDYNYADTLLQIAGKHIDILDIHYYWFWGRASFDNWKAQTNMQRPGGGTLADQRNRFKEIGKKYGRPDLDLVVLEWNVGPEQRAKAQANGQVGQSKQSGSSKPRTKSEIGLMIAEQFADVLSSGMPMACFWPVSWPSDMDRALLNSKDGYNANYAYYIFDQYKQVLGQNLLASKVSSSGVTSLAAKSNDGKTLWVYLVNKTKNEDPLSTTINIGSAGIKSVSSSIYKVNEPALPEASITPAEAILKNNKIELSLPQYSFTRLTIHLK